MPLCCCVRTLCPAATRRRTWIERRGTGNDAVIKLWSEKQAMPSSCSSSPSSNTPEYTQTALALQGFSVGKTPCVWPSWQLCMGGCKPCAVLGCCCLLCPERSQLHHLCCHLCVLPKHAHLVPNLYQQQYTWVGCLQRQHLLLLQHTTPQPTQGRQASNVAKTPRKHTWVPCVTSRRGVTVCDTASQQQGTYEGRVLGLALPCCAAPRRRLLLLQLLRLPCRLIPGAACNQLGLCHAMCCGIPLSRQHTLLYRGRRGLLLLNCSCVNCTTALQLISTIQDNDRVVILLSRQLPLLLAGRVGAVWLLLCCC